MPTVGRDDVQKIEECFKLRIENQINDQRLQVCLETYGKNITGHEVIVRVGDFKYPDIYNNVNVGIQNGKLVIDTMGIYIDNELFKKFDEKELTAAFLYELGLYEEIKRHPDLKYWILLGYSMPMLSHILALAFVVLVKASKKLKFDDKAKQYIALAIMYVMIVVIGLIAGLIGRYKSTRISNTTAFNYVIKYGYQRYYKSFILKHNPPVELYLYGGERKLPWNAFIRQLAYDLRNIGNIIAYGTPDKAQGKICKLNQYEYQLLKKYNPDDLEYLATIKEEIDKYCKKDFMYTLTSIKNSNLYKIMHAIYELLANTYGGIK